MRRCLCGAVGLGFTCPINVLLLLFSVSHGHTDFGLHGLSTDNPIGSPTLPAIEGAFEVELQARFANVATGAIHNVFEYSTDGHTDTIFFGVFTSTTSTALHLDVYLSGSNYSCSKAMLPALTEHTLYKYKFGVDAAGKATLFQDGVLQETCSNIPIPLNVPRTHSLGTGTLDGANGVERMRGAVVGLRVTNLGQPQHPRDALALMNIQSQSFASSFVASFYARFDNVTDGRSFQMLFDISNGKSSENIQCGQFSTDPRLYCEMIFDPPAKRVLTPNFSIVEGEFAFWHFGVHVNGTESSMWIDKNGVRLSTQSHDLPLLHVFRKSALYGATSFHERALDGVVLGFRLDRSIAS